MGRDADRDDDGCRDAEMDVPVVAEIREAIDTSPIKWEITDLHVWRAGKGKFACIISLSVDVAAKPEDFRQQLSVHEELVHVTVEITRRGGESDVLRLKTASV